MNAATVEVGDAYSRESKPVILKPAPAPRQYFEYLCQFSEESLAIEGATVEDCGPYAIMLANLLAQDVMNVRRMGNVVRFYHPSAVLRSRSGMDVRVGDYEAPRGGPRISTVLNDILAYATEHRGDEREAWRTYIEYQDLHPYTDGNGRSGRALWLWMMYPRRVFFLQEFHYQTLRFTNREGMYR